MGKSIRIVLLAVDDFSDGRKIANHIENTDYHTDEEVLEDILKREGLQTAGVGIYKPTNFMEACNEQQIELEGFWVSYVFVQD